MLWIALHCPTLSLDWIERRFPAPLVPAMAVTVRRGNQSYILQANKAAQQRGVAIRQPLASALALFPDLAVVEHDPDEERKALHEAAYAALRFTPRIVMQDSGLIAEISSSLKLFGGLKELCQSLNRAVAAQGLQLCAAAAPTARGAWLLAQSASLRTVINGTGNRSGSLLDALPVDLLASAQLHLEVIRGIGCRTLADLRQLPRGGLAQRFGPELPAELDQAYGNAPDPQEWFEPPPAFRQKMELMAQVEGVELLLMSVQRMTEQMCGWLAARHAAVREFSFLLHHEHSSRQPQASTLINIKLSERSSDPAHLMVLLRQRLERTTIAAPTCALELEANEIAAGENGNLKLFPAAQSEATSLNRFIEKLSSRLGHRTVTGLAIISDHRPEYSQRQQLFQLSGTSSDCETGRGNKAISRKAVPQKSMGRSTSFPNRPAWLMENPVELKLRNQQPVYGSPLQLLAGPERIEAGWWDDASMARDYFIAENELGQLLWIYREPGTAVENHDQWYLQGFFG
ncbi:MAG TPA: DNA polymerase Y family protein [Nitrosospira sp.]|nr:DNA polymerase Y family protein [Nitrosospira sp.]